MSQATYMVTHTIRNLTLQLGTHRTILPLTLYSLSHPIQKRDGWMKRTSTEKNQHTLPVQLDLLLSSAPVAHTVFTMHSFEEELSLRNRFAAQNDVCHCFFYSKFISQRLVIQSTPSGYSLINIELNSYFTWIGPA